MDRLKIMAYKRANGEVGIRNYVLILSVTHAAHLLAAKIGESLNNVKVFVSEDEDGRTIQDRNTIMRVLVGLGANPNVHSVLLICSSRNVAYKELRADYIADAIRREGKNVEMISIDELGGFYSALGEGIRTGRRLVREASLQMREEAFLGDLFVAVKCGLSDATSGIAGNPVVGYLGDRIIDEGGRFAFSETTEVIGAEHILAERCVNEVVREALLSAVRRTEEEAKSTGEDIRTINPIPANIEAGITTLEEKSVGAISKAGTKPLMGVIKYAERPIGNGLFFMDSWMSSTSLMLGYAASGVVMSIFQMGGGALPKDFVMPAIATGIVMPIMYVTGNPQTFAKAPDEIDFNAGTIISEKKTISQTGKELVLAVQKIASGVITKAETFNYQDRVEINLKGPNL